MSLLSEVAEILLRHLPRDTAAPSDMPASPAPEPKGTTKSSAAEREAALVATRAPLRSARKRRAS